MDYIKESIKNKLSIYVGIGVGSVEQDFAGPIETSEPYEHDTLFILRCGILGLVICFIFRN